MPQRTVISLCHDRKLKNQKKQKANLTAVCHCTVSGDYFGVKITREKFQNKLQRCPKSYKP